jgi:toxin YoeB
VILGFTAQARADCQFGVASDAATLRRINELIRDASRTPFSGIGRPEPLKLNWKGWWSRQITGEHRLVYRVTGTGAEQTLVIAACRFHYSA